MVGLRWLRPTGFRSAGFRSTGFQWTWLCVAGLAAALQVAPVRLSFAATPAPEDSWASLANDIFKGRPLADGTGLVSIEMPARAEDAAHRSRDDARDAPAG